MNRLFATLACLILGTAASAQDEADKNVAAKYSIYTTGCRLGARLVSVTDDLQQVSREVARLQAESQQVTVVTGAHDIKQVRSQTPKSFEVFRVSPRCGNVSSVGILYQKKWADEIAAKITPFRSFMVASY